MGIAANFGLTRFNINGHFIAISINRLGKSIRWAFVVNCAAKSLLEP
jgi:hypothetical protein